MSKIKRIASAVLAFATVCTFSVGALAAGNTMKINTLDIVDETAGDGFISVDVAFEAVGPEQITVIMSSQNLAEATSVDVDQIVYIDQIDTPADGKLAFQLDEEKVTALESSGELVDDTLYIMMGGTDVLTPGNLNNVINATDDGDDSGDGGSGDGGDVATGVAVKGAVISWDNGTDLKIRLYPESTSDEDITADMIKTESAIGVEADAIDAAVEADDKFSQAFTFNSVGSGKNYKLAISKTSSAGQPYVPVIKTIEVGDTETKLEDIAILLVGDMNSDGAVNSVDGVYLVKNVMKPTTYPIHASLNRDVNNDGETNSVDGVYLVKFTMKPDTYPLYPAASTN